MQQRAAVEPTDAVCCGHCHHVRLCFGSEVERYNDDMMWVPPWAAKAAALPTESGNLCCAGCYFPLGRVKDAYYLFRREHVMLNDMAARLAGRAPARVPDDQDLLPRPTTGLKTNVIMYWTGVGDEACSEMEEDSAVDGGAVDGGAADDDDIDVEAPPGMPPYLARAIGCR